MVTHVRHVAIVRFEAILLLKLEVPMKGVSEQWMERFRSELRKVQESKSKEIRLRKKMVQQRKRK